MLLTRCVSSFDINCLELICSDLSFQFIYFYQYSVHFSTSYWSQDMPCSMEAGDCSQMTVNSEHWLLQNAGKGEQSSLQRVDFTQLLISHTGVAMHTHSSALEVILCSGLYLVSL